MIIVNKPQDALIDAQCYKCKTIFNLHPMQNMNTDYVNDCALHRKACQHEQDFDNCHPTKNKCRKCEEFY